MVEIKFDGPKTKHSFQYWLTRTGTNRKTTWSSASAHTFVSFARSSMGLALLQQIWRIWLWNYRFVWNNAQWRPSGRSRSLKVIDFGTNRKPICHFLLVNNTNYILSRSIFENRGVLVKLSLLTASASIQFPRSEWNPELWIAKFGLKNQKHNSIVCAQNISIY